jgi:hypothetical protein
MCATCDFALPGDLHLCPSCATNPQTELSPARRKARAWSFALAGWSTLGMAAIFAGAFAHAARDKASQDALGTLLTFGVLIPAIVGLSVGLGAKDRRLSNPASLKAAIVWNGVIIGAFLLLMIAGLSS